MQSHQTPTRPVGTVASKPLLTVSELSRHLHVSPRTLRNWCQLGRIPHLRLEGNIRFDRHEIALWLDGQRHGA